MLIVDLHNDQQLTDSNKEKEKRDREALMKLIQEQMEANKGDDDEENEKATSEKGIKKPDAEEGGGCFACCGPRKDDESDSDEAKKSDDGEEENIPEPKVKEKKSLRPFMI